MIIYKIIDIPKNLYSAVGSKAKGLKKLISVGLKVPSGFIVTDMHGEEDYLFAADYYARSGLKNVAVRPSMPRWGGESFLTNATCEAVLDVNDRRKFQAAIKTTIKSLNLFMAKNCYYFFEKEKKNSVSIIVQGMVDAKIGGICFSKNPVSGKSEIVIEAVRGSSNALICGKAKPTIYRAACKEFDGRITSVEHFETASTGKLLSKQQLIDIGEGVAKASELFGYPVALEWVIDKEGEIFWLQVEPITTLKTPKINEFDAKFADKDTIFVRQKIEKRLKGAITPLSLSTSIRAMDSAAKVVLSKSGACKNPKQLSEDFCIASFSNQLFINLSNFYKMADSLIYIDNHDIQLDLCRGETNLPFTNLKKKKKLVRLKNSVVFIGFFMSYKKAVKKLDQLASSAFIKDSNQPSQLYENINAKIDLLTQATLYHYISLTHFKIMKGILLRRVQRLEKIAQKNHLEPEMKPLESDENQLKSDENQLELATQKSNCEFDSQKIWQSLSYKIDGMDELDISASLREIAREILREYPAAAEVSMENLEKIITSDDKAIKSAYNNFIKTHGHHSFKELELKELAWKNDQAALIGQIMREIKLGAAEPQSPKLTFECAKEQLTKGLKFRRRKLVKYAANQFRLGLHAKTHTKSQYIKIINLFKDSYKKLASLMEEKRIISDASLLYFFTHDELRQLLIDKDARLVNRAVQRQRLFICQNEQTFKDINEGNPKPTLDLDNIAKKAAFEHENGQTLKGDTASRGQAKGYARVINNIEELTSAKKGEILITNFNHSAFIPSYNFIYGIIAERGSQLSKSAVAAREYGLPLIINVSDATKIISSGDYIYMDAHEGTITILHKNQQQ